MLQKELYSVCKSFLKDRNRALLSRKILYIKFKYNVDVKELRNLTHTTLTGMCKSPRQKLSISLELNRIFF